MSASFPRAFSFWVATSGSFCSRGPVGMAVVASSSAGGGCPAERSLGTGIARVGSADGFDGGAALPGPGRSFGFGPRSSLSQDSISRSPPRGGWDLGGGAAGVLGGRSRPGTGPPAAFGWADIRVVGGSLGSGCPGARILVVPAADGVLEPVVGIPAAAPAQPVCLALGVPAGPLRSQSRGGWGRAVDAASQQRVRRRVAVRRGRGGRAACVRRAGESRRVRCGSAAASSTSAPTSSHRQAASSPTGPGTSG